MNLYTKQKQTHKYRKQTYGYQRGKGNQIYDYQRTHRHRKQTYGYQEGRGWEE